ncbi:hypothetical protein ACL2XP_23035 [Sodalis sp. RH21]|uniref:hypothetical protein n=1 Tax=unclassified Sodalis (in: enterobacteria) TaxID=2636512 RepID=UPI0039B687DE
MEILNRSAGYPGYGASGHAPAVDITARAAESAVHQQRIARSQTEGDDAAGRPSKGEGSTGKRKRGEIEDGAGLTVPGLLPRQVTDIPQAGKRARRDQRGAGSVGWTLDGRLAQSLNTAAKSAGKPAPTPLASLAAPHSPAPAQETFDRSKAKHAAPPPASEPEPRDTAGAPTPVDQGEPPAAAYPAMARPLPESAPSRPKAPDWLAQEPRQGINMPAPQRSSTAPGSGKTATFTFKSEYASGVNSVQISLDGQKILMPSNKLTHDNLLANRPEADGYRVMPASDQQRQRGRDREEPREEDQ